MSPLLAAVAMVGVTGVSVYALTRTADTSLEITAQQQLIRGNQQVTLLAQGLRTLTRDTDRDGVLELSITSLPGKDPWGTGWTLCAWDRSSSDEDGVLAAVLSAGPDRVFQTTCTVAGTGEAGDDLVRRVMLPDARDTSHAAEGQTSALRGAPVATLAQLRAMVTDNPLGQVRLAMENNQNYVWDGDSWERVGEDETVPYWTPGANPEAPTYNAVPVSALSCGGGSCLAAIDPWGSAVYAGSSSYAAGYNTGAFGAGYTAGSTYLTLQPLSVGDTSVVSASNGTAAFISPAGALFTAGQGTHGKLGNGGTANTAVFSQVASGVAGVAVGAGHTVRRDADGSVWGVGNQQGYKKEYPYDGLIWERIFQAQANPAVAVVAGGSSVAVLLADGMLLTAGFPGACGVLGKGTRHTGGDSRYSASNLSAVVGGVSAIAASSTATWAVVSGTLMASGCNQNNELGTAAALGSYTTTFRSTGMTGIRTIAAADGMAAAVKDNEELWAAGRNTSCQVRSPATANSAWVKVADGVAAVWVSNDTLMWQDTQGRVWGRGRDGGQLNQGSTSTGRCVPVQVR